MTLYPVLMLEIRIVHFLTATLSILLLTCACAAPSAASGECAVLAAATDVYRRLAEEIAAEEAFPLFSSLPDAIADRPECLIWIASPEDFSDEDVAEFGLLERELGSMISVGIITGRTIDEARALWQRSRLVGGERISVFKGEYPSAHRAPFLVYTATGNPQIYPLTVETMQYALEHSDYVTYRGHGTPTSLKFTEEDRFKAEHVPDLPPLVMAADACNTLRFWDDESIAMGFVSKGAAGYVGSAYSPIAGSISGLPLEYTYPGFPIGHAVAVQARAVIRMGSRFRFFYLLGDPRTCFRREPPYRLVQDREENGVRTLVCEEAPVGVLPVRVPGAGEFEYAEISGVGAVSDGDLFANVRLHTAAIGDDKLILFVHQGGPFEVRLRKRAPVTWRLNDPILKSLDNALVVNFDFQRGGGLICTGWGLLAGLVLWVVIRRKRRHWLVWPGIVAGLDLALIHGIYAYFRVKQITFVDFQPIFATSGLIGTFLIGFVGGIVFVNTKSRKGHVLGILTAALPFLGGSVAVFVVLGIVNRLVAQRAGQAIYGYALGYQNLVAAIVIIVILTIYFHALRGVVRLWQAETARE